MKITRALISVSDKNGDRRVCARAGETGRRYYFHWRHGGTVAQRKSSCARHFQASRIFPKCSEGRVKTLHPQVHGGLLYKRGNPETRSRSAGARLPADRSRGGESLSV